ncbi:sugar efflux transporter [Vibrio mangrovi]|uniref:Sugar efflux transporter n=1 Tax=Vibrio mangrovi TaxID=474394 RepID=A0A1Y6IWN6_9VIBR|nr:sugar efflux transporter [Vibrio mangrovi]MDW6005520.1 sugar efflux transporter [Vibrio mangrovi]SMS02038.1 Sugar efflux transporter C [Vibrio mangrovi]
MRFEVLRGDSGVYFWLNGLSAMAFSFILPVMSLFLIEGLGIEPMYIGLYTVGTAVSTILISQGLGRLADKGVDSKILLLTSVLFLCLAAICFYYLTQFWQAIIVGWCFMAFGASSVPLLLAMIRRFAEQSGKDSTKLNSQMRSSVSLVWIVGPALAFTSVDTFGFRTNFLMAGGIALLVFIMAWRLLPSAVKSARKTNVHDAIPPFPYKVWFLGVGILFANMANSTYINAMPLFVTKELDLPVSYPGMFMGLTAALEIPVMLLSASWSHRVGKMQLMMVSFAVAMVFYIGIQYASTVEWLLALQFVNGLFYGIFVGLGITLLQDSAPKRVGQVSAFYTNAMSVGTMCGTSLMGFVAQHYGFRNSVYISLVAVVISFGIFLAVHLNESRQAKLSEIQHPL